MAIEIERKFLVKGSFKNLANDVKHIKQGYLNSNPNRAVRVRVCNNLGFITVKGKSSNNGLSRFEWEKPIDINDALQLLLLCEPVPIEKTRYIINYKGHVFEVDEFEGLNQGLVIAEVEIATPDEFIDLPVWIGEEVTNVNKYYNSQLSVNPFLHWK